MEVGDGNLLVMFYNASHPEAEHNGVFATFLDCNLFRTAFGGVRLADVGSVRRADTVAWWRFDEGADDTAHDDTGRHSAVLHGPTWTEGRYGTALAFDGVHDHLRVTNCPSLWLGQELALEAWIRTPHPEREQTIVCKLPHYWFGLSRGRVCLRRGGEHGIAAASCHGTAELAADRWHHVAVVVRETADSMRRALFYVDGALDADGRSGAAGVGGTGAGAQRLAADPRPRLAGVLHSPPQRAHPLGGPGTPVHRHPSRPPYGPLPPA